VWELVWVWLLFGLLSKVLDRFGMEIGYQIWGVCMNIIDWIEVDVYTTVSLWNKVITWLHYKEMAMHQPILLDLYQALISLYRGRSIGRLSE
jgi:hypothetical protein